MKKQLKNKSHNPQVVKMTILGLSLSLLIGCQQVQDFANSNSNINVNNNGSRNINTSVEQVNSSANVNNNTANTVGKTEEINSLKTQLLGSWKSDYKVLPRIDFDQKYTKFYQSDGKLFWKTPYSIVDDKIVKFLLSSSAPFEKEMRFEDNNSAFVWKTDALYKYKRESNKAEEDSQSNGETGSGNSLWNNLIGVWNDTSKTNSEGEQLYLTRYDWETFQNNEKKFGDNYQIDNNGVVKFNQKSPDKKVSVNGDVLTVTDDKGVEKKYNRKTTVD